MLRYLSVLLVILLQACGHPKNEVVVYVTIDRLFAEPVLDEFEKETGITVKPLYDTEETKSTGIMNRLIAEKDHPRCDVFWSGDPIRASVLKEKQLLQVFYPENATGISSEFIDPDGYWIGFSARARVLLYNKDLIPEDSVPSTILDLAEKKFNRKVAIANPLFGTTTFHLAALFSYLGDDAAKEFLNALKLNGVVIASSNGDVKRKVGNGEVVLGLTDTDDALGAIMEGKNVGFIFLDQEGIGSLIMPNTVSLVKGAPNSDNAKKLIEYLLSAETEKKLAESCGQMPLHKGVSVPNFVPSLDSIKAMKIDYALTSQKLESIQPFLKQWAEN